MYSVFLENVSEKFGSNGLSLQYYLETSNRRVDRENTLILWSDHPCILFWTRAVLTAPGVSDPRRTCAASAWTRSCTRGWAAPRRPARRRRSCGAAPWWPGRSRTWRASRPGTAAPPGCTGLSPSSWTPHFYYFVDTRLLQIHFSRIEEKCVKWSESLVVEIKLCQVSFRVDDKT